MHYFIGLGFVLFIYGIHMLPISDSMLNENNTKLSQVFLVSQIRYHQEFAPFARRPLTSMLIEGTSGVAGITLGEAFVLVNFLLLYICGLLVFKVTLKLNGDRKQAILNLVFYFLTFSIVFAFFPPVFTYDEPLQYCLLLLSILALIHNKWAYYIFFFFLALVARESSVFLLPGIVIIGLGSGLVSRKVTSGLEVRKWFLLFLPLALYAVYLVLFLWYTGLWQETSELARGRFQCIYENFGSLDSALETVFSFILVLGPVLYLFLMAQRSLSFNGMQKRYIKAFFFVIVINTPIVMLATLAREARLFALPLIFLWPLVGQLFGKEMAMMCKARLYMECFCSLRNILYLIGAVILNYWISFKLYLPSFPTEDNFFNEYLFIMLLLISVHFILHNNQREHRCFLKGQSNRQTGNSRTS